MQNNSTELRYHHTDEINLLNLFKLILQRKWFIFGLTGFITMLAVIYSLSITPTYMVSTFFTLADESSLLNINKTKLTTETRESIFTKFLTRATSKEFQKKVFHENDYLAKLNPDDKPINDIDSFVEGFLKRIVLSSPHTIAEGRITTLEEKPYMLSMEGPNGEIMSQFLNQLVSTANNETIDNFLCKRSILIINKQNPIFTMNYTNISSSSFNIRNILTHWMNDHFYTGEILSKIN